MGGLSSIESLSSAWEETLRLLFRPFQGRLWIRLSVVCLFLGGGASTAAFQWGFSTLPGDIHPAQILLRARLILGQHLSLIILAVVLSLGLALSLLYVRCVLRFVLVEAILNQEFGAKAGLEGPSTVRPRLLFLVAGGVKHIAGDDFRSRGGDFSPTSVPPMPQSTPRGPPHCCS